MTSIGGLIGIAAGIILAQLISKFADVPVAISGISIAVSVIFSMAVGIVFGLIPSVKKAQILIRLMLSDMNNFIKITIILEKSEK